MLFHPLENMTQRFFVMLGMVNVLHAAEPRTWTVPLAGNAFVTQSAEGSGDRIEPKGMRWRDQVTVLSIYFRVDRACDLELSGRQHVMVGESTMRVSAEGKTWSVQVKGAEPQEAKWGSVSINKPGYVRVDLQGETMTGDSYAQISDLLVRSSNNDLEINFVKNNEGNMFYWGRRGPSVHLSYEMPRDKDITYSYSELTVPVGEDPPGSYFMANGFGEGYFGIQVKSATERWILFSVWSPFKTDDPISIPEEDRIQTLAKGDGVRVGAFGGEGSGGQSYRVYPWKAGVTYRFLNSVKPDGKGNSVYSAWFGEVGKDGWQLMARFQRPKTNKHLTGFHSFLENFYDRDGFRERRSVHSNQWVCDTSGQWHELNRANFTCDATGGGGHRLDFAGGAAGKGFFMRNGGFFSENVKAQQTFERESTSDKKPVIDFLTLP
jgi:hypothetical protein